MTHLSVPEWGRVPIGEKGFTPAQADLLMAAARAHPLGGDEGTGILSEHRHYLRAGQMVGVLAASGCSLEILPKVDPDAPDEAAPTVRRRLIDLLDLALGLNLGSGASAAMAHRAENLLDILIKIFAERLLAETRRGLPRQYLPHENDLPTLRGRLDVVRQFTHLAVRPDRLACRYDQLSINIPLLQIMKATVSTLRRLSRSTDTQRLLDELRFVLAEVDDMPLSSLPWGRVRIDRSNTRWASLLALARLLIKRDWQSTTYSAQAEGGVSLLFPMNDLFEAAVAALLKRALAGTGIEVNAQSGLRYCLGDWTGSDDCDGYIFQTKPDLILKRGKEVLAIIDTKWKRVSIDPMDRKKGVKQPDVYQMMAYARLYRCHRLMLLYPTVHGDRAGIVRRYGIGGGREALMIGKIDLSANQKLVAGELSRMVHALLENMPIASTQLLELESI